MADKIKVLLLATNQVGFVYVGLGNEVREIDNKVQLATFRESFELISQPAVKASDLGMLLLRYEPHILHFSSHGNSSDGIILEDEAGFPTPVEADHLKRILLTHKSNTRLVFLNLCHSKLYAEAISEVVDYAIGMDGVIKDKSAIAFAASFYQALAFGRSVKEAFEVAKEHLRMRRLAGAEVPVLVVKEGVDDPEPFIRRGVDAERSKSLVRRLVDGTANEDDRLMIQREVIAGRIIFDEMESDLAGESDAQETYDILARDNQLQVRLSTAAYGRVERLLFP